jgi:peptide/nickel transport system ATP-binding protein
MSPLLSVWNLRVEIPTRRGSLFAVDDVSFEIDAGEIMGVVGESGAGKSMAGMAIIGLLDPPARIAGGNIMFAGRRIDNLTADAMHGLHGRHISAVFQDPLTSLNPVLTIGHQLVQAMTTHQTISRREARQRAAQLLAEVGVAAAHERLDAYPHELSGGMRQRVVIALAFCCNPQFVIADEPTTALDVSVQAQVVELLRRISREHGTAVMLITHDIGVIAQVADRVAVMYAGRVVEIGATRVVLKNPSHPYTRGLMASIPTLGRRAANLSHIEGSMPRLNAIPSGCAFHPRCTSRLPRCGHDRPELGAANGTSSACWLNTPGTVAAETSAAPRG